MCWNQCVSGEHAKRADLVLGAVCDGVGVAHGLVGGGVGGTSSSLTKTVRVGVDVLAVGVEDDAVFGDPLVASPGRAKVTLGSSLSKVAADLCSTRYHEKRWNS